MFYFKQILKISPKQQTSTDFPHENKRGNIVDFHQNLYAGTAYDLQVADEIADFMKRNGFDIKKSD